MAKNHEKLLTILAIKEMKLKTILRSHFTPIRMTTIKNTTTNVGEYLKEKEPSYTAGGNVN
jgi:hypothetical protein